MDLSIRKEMKSRTEFYMKALGEEKRLLVDFINTHIESIMIDIDWCIAKEKPDVTTLENAISYLQKAIQTCLRLRKELLDLNAPDMKGNEVYSKSGQPHQTREAKASDNHFDTWNKNKHPTEMACYVDTDVNTRWSKSSSSRKRNHKPTNSKTGLLKKAFKGFKGLASRRKKSSTPSRSSFTTAWTQERRCEKLPNSDVSTPMLDSPHKYHFIKQHEKSKDNEELNISGSKSNSSSRETVSNLQIQNPSLISLQDDRSSFNHVCGIKKYLRRSQVSFHSTGNNDSGIRIQENQVTSSLVISNPSVYSLDQSTPRNSSEDSTLSDFGRCIKMRHKGFPNMCSFEENTRSEIRVQEDQKSSSLVISCPFQYSLEQSRTNSICLRIKEIVDSEIPRQVSV